MGVRQTLAVLPLLGLPLWGAITRAVRGTAQSKTAAAVFDSDSIAASDVGASFVIVLAHDPATISSVELRDDAITPPCDGNLVATFAKNVETTNTGNVQISVWSAHNLSAPDGCVKVTFATSVVAKAMTISQLSGTNGALVFDTSATGTGTGTDASTASITCAPNSGADCGWIGGVGTEGPVEDTAGTWVNPNNAGSRSGTTGGTAVSNITASEGYEIDSASVTQALSKTGMTSRDWAAVLATYKEPAAGGLTIKDVHMRGRVAAPR